MTAEDAVRIDLKLAIALAEQLEEVLKRLVHVKLTPQHAPLHGALVHQLENLEFLMYENESFWDD